MEHSNSLGLDESVLESRSPFNTEEAEHSLDAPAIYRSTTGSHHTNEPLEPWQLTLLLDNETEKAYQLHAQVMQLTETVAALRQENQALTEELNSLRIAPKPPELGEVLALQQHVVQVEAELAKYVQYSRKLKSQLSKLSKTNKSLQCGLNGNTLALSSENLEISAQCKQHPQNTSALIPELLQILELEDASDLLTTVSRLKQSKKGEVLLHKLSSLMMQCMQGLTNRPSASHVWKWIRRVLEDLVKCERLLNKTQDMLGVSSHQEIEYGIAYLLTESKQLRRLVSLVKEYFGLGADIDDQEIEWLLTGNAYP